MKKHFSTVAIVISVFCTSGTFASTISKVKQLAPQVTQCGTLTMEAKGVWLEVPSKDGLTAVKVVSLYTRNKAVESVINNAEPYTQKICVTGTQMKDPVDRREESLRRDAMMVRKIELKNKKS